METCVTTKEQIIRALDELPPASLHDVQQFLEFLRFKNQQDRDSAIALGGLLDGYQFSEKDIAQARREMWSRIEENVP